MRISGFTMVRNAGKYYFPIKESIQSILPIVDEFIVALGDCDEDDDTLAQIESIQSDKIKIYHRVWDEQQFIDGHVFKVETDFAMDQCSGDWLFYLQADEVIHEDHLDSIVEACKLHQKDERVDGLLLKYYHFWGDYNHHLPYHGWCRKEIRLVKPNRNIRSYKDAVSFRKDSKKLNVKLVDATIFHYGYVRPPHIMNTKKKEQDGMHLGKETAEKIYKDAALPFDFGNMNKLPKFSKSHPKVMHQRMQALNWNNHLTTNSIETAPRELFKHEKLKYRLLSTLENFLNIEIFSFKNYNLLK